MHLPWRMTCSARAHPVSRRRLGQVYLGLGRTSDAIAVGKGLVAQPNASYESWGLLGDAYQAAGQLADAERTFVEAAGKFPKLPIAHWRLGTIYGFQRKYDLAIGAFNRGLAIAPDDPSLLRGLALAQNQSGNRKAAILTAEKLVKLQPGDAEAAFLLGTLYQDLGTQAPFALNHRNWAIYEENCHATSFAPGSGLARIYPKTGLVKTNSIHHQAVKALGRDLVVEAWSEPDRIVEALRWKGPSYLFGVQWHPEFHDPEDASFLDDTPILDDFLTHAAQHKDAAFAL